MLLRKHEQIRKALGISVPVPDRSDDVVQAILEGLLLRDAPGEQLAFEGIGLENAPDLHREWDSAVARERQSRTKYAQAGIQPAEVQREIDDVRSVLGTDTELRGLVQRTLTELGSTVRESTGGLIASIGNLPLGLRNALPIGKSDPLLFADDLPVGRSDSVLLRTDESVAAIAHYVLQSALDPELPAKDRPAHRCAVIRTHDVVKRTTLLLVRYRFHLELPSRSGDRKLVAEDLVALAFAGSPANPEWLDDASPLFAALPSRMSPRSRHVRQRPGRSPTWTTCPNICARSVSSWRPRRWSRTGGSARPATSLSAA